ncbi:MAG: hypothetical protein MJ227_03315 [Bacilli bacterium]|nr:hypothetical protein [Bacilli bacterium]
MSYPIIKSLPVFLTLSLVGLPPVKPIEYKLEVFSDLYGPFTAFQDDVIFSFKVKDLLVPDSTSETFTLSLFDGTILETVFPSNKYQEGRYTYYDVPLHLSYLFSNSGLKFTYKLYNPIKGVVFTENNVKFLPLTKRTINANNYQNEDFIISDTMDSFSQNICKTETFSFKKTINYFPNVYYNTLSLNGIYFKYETPFPKFEYQNASLVIFDKNNIFPNLNKDKNHETRIPIDALYESNRVYFKFKNRFFVEPNLNLISLEAKIGYLPTDEFYLPKNKLKEIEDVLFSIEINEMGRNKTTVIYPIDYLATRNLFGKCSNSDYCIVGGFHD